MQKYVKDHGLEYIRPALEQKVDEMGEKSGVQMLYDFSISKDMVRSTVKSFYAHAVEDHMDGFMQKIDLASLIDQRHGCHGTGEHGAFGHEKRAQYYRQSWRADRICDRHPEYFYLSATLETW